MLFQLREREIEERARRNGNISSGHHITTKCGDFDSRGLPKIHRRQRQLNILFAPATERISNPVEQVKVAIFLNPSLK